MIEVEKRKHSPFPLASKVAAAYYRQEKMNTITKSLRKQEKERDKRIIARARNKVSKRLLNVHMTGDTYDYYFNEYQRYTKLYEKVCRDIEKIKKVKTFDCDE